MAGIRVCGKHSRILLQQEFRGPDSGQAGFLRARLDGVPVILNHSESWPGLSRPSTSSLLKCLKKGVDARDKRGHDAGGAIRSHFRDRLKYRRSGGGWPFLAGMSKPSPLMK